MKTALNLFSPVIRKMLIPAFAATGGFLVGLYPAELSAFCSGVF